MTVVAQNIEPQFKASKKTDLDELNELIDWYEKYKPEAGKCIQVWKTPKELHKMLGLTPQTVEGKEVIPQELPHRGRTILAIGPR